MARIYFAARRLVDFFFLHYASPSLSISSLFSSLSFPFLSRFSLSLAFHFFAFLPSSFSPRSSVFLDPPFFSFHRAICECIDIVPVARTPNFRTIESQWRRNSIASIELRPRSGTRGGQGRERADISQECREHFCRVYAESLDSNGDPRIRFTYKALALHTSNFSREEIFLNRSFAAIGCNLDRLLPFPCSSCRLLS